MNNSFMNFVVLWLLFGNISLTLSFILSFYEHIDFVIKRKFLFKVLVILFLGPLAIIPIIILNKYKP